MPSPSGNVRSTTYRGNSLLRFVRDPCSTVDGRPRARTDASAQLPMLCRDGYLSWASRTVDHHVSAILRKLDVRTRAAQVECGGARVHHGSVLREDAPLTTSYASNELLERASELSALGECLKAVQRSSRGRVLLIG